MTLWTGFTTSVYPGAGWRVFSEERDELQGQQQEAGPLLLDQGTVMLILLQLKPQDIMVILKGTATCRSHLVQP